MKTIIEQCHLARLSSLAHFLEANKLVQHEIPGYSARNVVLHLVSAASVEQFFNTKLGSERQLLNNFLFAAQRTGWQNVLPAGARHAAERQRA